MKNYYIYTGGAKNDLFDILFMDLKNTENVKLISKVPVIPGNKQKKWDFFHKPSLNRKKPFALRSIWNKYSGIDEADLGSDDYLIFSNVAVIYYEPSLIKRLKEKGVHTILYMLDTWNSYYSWQARLAYNYGCFEKVYSFHMPDAKEHGFEYLKSYYSKQAAKEKLPEFDCFFWGSDKGRADKIEALYKELTAKGVKCDFGICFTNDGHEKVPGITYDKPLTYPEMIDRMMNSKCLVDFTGSQSEGMSLRVYEAIAYGRKLLTDNKLVSELKYYSDDNMQIFDSANSINTEFCKSVANDYHYEGDYSPVKWIEELEQSV